MQIFTYIKFRITGMGKTLEVLVHPFPKVTIAAGIVREGLVENHNFYLYLVGIRPPPSRVYGNNNRA